MKRSHCPAITSYILVAGLRTHFPSRLHAWKHDRLQQHGNLEKKKKEKGDEGDSHPPLYVVDANIRMCTIQL